MAKRTLKFRKGNTDEFHVIDVEHFEKNIIISIDKVMVAGLSFKDGIHLSVYKIMKNQLEWVPEMDIDEAKGTIRVNQGI